MTLVQSLRVLSSIGVPVPVPVHMVGVHAVGVCGQDDVLHGILVLCCPYHLVEGEGGRV